VAGVESRDFESPDETRTPEKTQVDVVRMGTATVGRFAFESGCVKPVAGTESCQARHVGVVHSGRLAIRHGDGTEVEIGPGEAYVIEPGHDAWVVDDERFVAFEFKSRAAEEYADVGRRWSGGACAGPVAEVGVLGALMPCRARARARVAGR
jgi:hypothetical protein